MKAMDLLTLLGDVDEELLAASETAAPHRSARPRRRKALKWLVAACICVGFLSFAVWFFVPPATVINQSSKFVVIRVEDRLASYTLIRTGSLSPFERLCLPNTPGDILCTHGENTFYRTKEREDLVYLIQERGDGSRALLQFEHLVPLHGADMTQSYWYTSGWLTDADISALTPDVPTMGETLELIYGVTSAEDIASIRLAKDGTHHDSVSKQIRIKPVTIRKREDVERLYRILCQLIPAAPGEALPGEFVSPLDEAYLSGENPLSAQVNREITVRLTGGQELKFDFTPTTKGICHIPGNLCTILSEADSEWLIGLAGIDMEWRDWGTEEPVQHNPGDADETATVPVPPEISRP